jgi:hypothetical protein
MSDSSHPGDAAGDGSATLDSSSDASTADSSTTDGNGDGGNDGGHDGGSDGATEAGGDDSGSDGATEGGGGDASEAASDGGHEGGVDSGPDAAADTGVDSGKDASVDDGAVETGPDGGDAGLDGGACNSVSNLASVVPLVASSAPFPTPLGGLDVTAGTYYVVAATLYSDAGLSFATIQSTSIASGPANNLTVQTVTQTAPAPESRTSDVIVFSSVTKQAVFTPTCGSNNQVVDYTAESTSHSPFLRVHLLYPGSLEIVYEKQP